jgi:hypothetical protein
MRVTVNHAETETEQNRLNKSASSAEKRRQ